MEKIVWELPLRTVSESNCSEHWTKKSKRHRQQQFFIRALFSKETKKVPIPCIVTMTRISRGFLDEEDNLPVAFKWIKDEIGACIFPKKVVAYKTKSGALARNKGHADSDPRVKWKYAQEYGNRMGVRIEIQPLLKNDPENSQEAKDTGLDLLQ